MIRFRHGVAEYDLHELCDEWHITINFTLRGTNQVTFLDLDLELVDALIRYKLHVKYKHLHQHVPPASAHLNSCHSGLCIAESTRTKRRKQYPIKATSHSTQFMRWPRDRGHQPSHVHRMFSTPRSSTSSRILTGMTLTFSKAPPIQWIRQQLKKIEPMVNFAMSTKRRTLRGQLL